MSHHVVSLGTPTAADEVAVHGGLLLYCAGDRLWHDYRIAPDPDDTSRFTLQRVGRYDTVPAGVPILDSLRVPKLWMRTNWHIYRLSRIGMFTTPEGDQELGDAEAAWVLPRGMREYPNGLALRGGLYLLGEDSLNHLILPVLQNPPFVDPGDWSWVTDDDDSDLVEAGGLQSKRMISSDAPDNSGTFSFNIPVNSTKVAYFFSDPGEPGSELWSSLSTALAIVNVSTANSRIDLTIQLGRVSDSGMFRQSYASFGGTINLASTGPKNFQMSPSPQVGAQDTDRMRMALVFTRGTTLGTGVVGISFGNPAHDSLSAPVSNPDSSIVQLEDVGQAPYYPFAGTP